MNIFTPLKVREEHFIKRLNEKYPMFEYISGYEHSDKYVLLRCKVCGYEFKRTAHIVRSNKNLTCNNCVKLKRNIKRNRKQYIQQLINKYNIRKRKEKEEIKRIYKELIKNTQYIQTCNKCKSEFIEHSKSKYCSLCRKKIHHHHSYKSLKELYKRDKGICHICGGKCDYEDYIVRDGTIICGNYYPSIDHVIPIAKGGTDDWNNIKLAHRICNTIKRDKII